VQLPPPDTLRDLRAKKELLVEAATLFNEKPKKGIQFLQV
jgi:Sec7-like guanine-nucleotide exchange factor